MVQTGLTWTVWVDGAGRCRPSVMSSVCPGHLRRGAGAGLRRGLLLPLHPLSGTHTRPGLQQQRRPAGLGRPRPLQPGRRSVTRSPSAREHKGQNLVICDLVFMLLNIFFFLTLREMFQRNTFLLLLKSFSPGKFLFCWAKSHAACLCVCVCVF